MDRGRDRFSLSGRRLPPAFELREIAVPPGRARAYDEAEWLDALVVVEYGEIELEGLSGNCRMVRRGDVLWLVGLPLRALRNRGTEPAVLAAVSRRRQGEAMSFEPACRLTRDEDSDSEEMKSVRAGIAMCRARYIGYVRTKERR